MATISGSRTITPACVTLGRTCQLAELLTVLRTFSPAALHAGVMAGASALRLREVIHEHVLRVHVAHNLAPYDGRDVA